MCEGPVTDPVGNYKPEVKKDFILKRYFEKITCVGASLSLLEINRNNNLDKECNPPETNPDENEFTSISSMSF